MAKKKKKSSAWKWQIFMIVSLITTIMFIGVTVLLVIGMIPTIVAGIVDRTENRIRTITIGAMNLAGCTPFIIEIFKKGNDFTTAMNYIIQPRTIVVMYFAAGMGYLIDWAMTGIVSSIMVQKSKMRVKEIQKEQKILTERWGQEVTGTVPLDEFGFPRDAFAPKAEDQHSL